MHIKNIWHAGHDKRMVNFKSVAYVYKQCRSKYSAHERLIGVAKTVTGRDNLPWFERATPTILLKSYPK